jgi:hypothetical protein
MYLFQVITCTIGLNKVIINKSFVATREQETMASPSRRIKQEVNYGNFLVSKKIL